MARRADGSTFVVGRYLPAGNKAGQFKENVLPKLGEQEEKVEEKPDVAPPIEEPVDEEKPTFEPTQFAKDMLKRHNKYRADHATGPMTLNVKLCQEAQKWAEHIASTGQLEHESQMGRRGAGENLARDSKELTADMAVDMWYNESVNYDFSNPGYGGFTGHFSRVIWKGSKEFGAGMARRADGSTFVVGRYLPAGNKAGQFKENVLPKLAEQEERVEEKPDIAPPIEEPVDEEKPTFEPTQFAKDMLKKHNKYRADHATGLMTLNVKLCQEAQKWAEHIASTGQLEHESQMGRRGAGENLARDSKELTADMAVDMWYNESVYYDFSNPGYAVSTGHFSQVIWKGSKEFGAGMARRADGSTFVVGRYLPAGNMMGQFKQNVRPKP